MNREAFAWGRWLAADPDAVEAALDGAVTAARRSQSAIWDPSARSTARAPELVGRGRSPAGAA